MRLLIIVVFCALFQLGHAQNSIKELELISISQLVSNDERRFDLSGLVCIDNKYYIIADKQWNNFIYEIRFSKDYWYITGTIGFDVGEDELGMEALDFCGDAFYMANEDNGEIYSKTVNGKIRQLSLPFEAAGIKPGTWGNAGWEGLAVDCEQNIMYLAKERQPRFIVKVDLNTGDVLDSFNTPQNHSNDFSDLKYENGFLYLLERNGNYITKVNPVTHEVVAKYSYRHVCSVPEPDGKLYDDEKYGMAEALLMTPEEIWIGLDNNGHTVSKYAHRTYDLHGNKPVILKFNRPQGF